MFLANPRLPATELDSMRRALTGCGRTPAGEQFFSTSGYNGIVPLDDVYMKTIDIYIPETRRILASGG